MRERPSEIFNSYVDMMVKQAAEREESKELKKYKKDPAARNGSDDEETIKNLYPPPNTPDKFKENIINQAHPKSVVIAPAHDPLNGLVENENERASIIRNIINRPLPSGTIQLTRYASTQSLMMELIRVANDMDNQDKQDLRFLADLCLNQLKKESGFLDEAKDWIGNKIKDLGGIGEGALAGAGAGALLAAVLGSWTGPGEVLIIPAGAVLGGLIAAFAKTGPQIKSIQENGQKVADQLKDLEVKIPEQQAFFSTVQTALVGLIGEATRYQNVVDDLKMKAMSDHHTPTDFEKKDAAEITAELKKRMDAAQGLGRLFEEKRNEGEFAKAAPNKALTPLYWLISDDIEDVSDAFLSLNGAIESFKRTMDQLQSSAVSESKEKESEKSNPSSPDK